MTSPLPVPRRRMPTPGRSRPLPTGCRRGTPTHRRPRSASPAPGAARAHRQLAMWGPRSRPHVRSWRAHERQTGPMGRASMGRESTSSHTCRVGTLRAIEGPTVSGSHLVAKCSRTRRLAPSSASLPAPTETSIASVPSMLAKISPSRAPEDSMSFLDRCAADAGQRDLIPSRLGRRGYPRHRRRVRPRRRSGVMACEHQESVSHRVRIVVPPPPSLGMSRYPRPRPAPPRSGPPARSTCHRRGCLRGCKTGLGMKKGRTMSRMHMRQAPSAALFL